MLRVRGVVVVNEGAKSIVLDVALWFNPVLRHSDLSTIRRVGSPLLSTKKVWGMRSGVPCSESEDVPIDIDRNSARHFVVSLVS